MMTAMLGLESLQAGQSVQAGHSDVEQDHIRLQFLSQLQAALAGIALADDLDPVGRGKHRAQASSSHLVIVDEQDSRVLVHDLYSPNPGT